MSSNAENVSSSSLPIKKFFPTIDDCQIKNFVRCPEEDCESTFNTESNLQLHLIKTHHKQDLMNTTKCIKQYYCPEKLCPYNEKKHFKDMKTIRQHYLKIHMVKVHNCDNCSKGFHTEKLLEVHKPFCNVKFYCCDCKAFYYRYETLRTHARRKKHNILPKTAYTLNSSITRNVMPNVIAQKKHVTILPKAVNEILKTCNKEIQTVPTLQNKLTQVECDLQPSVKTQTNMDLNKVLLFNYQNSNTQTDAVISKTKSCNTSFNLTDFVLNDVETYSSGTQTALPTFDSTHTDTSDLPNIDNFDSFDNCNIQTQTESFFDEDLFNCDYLMSNMYTQTCDDIFNQLGLNDIQTQTMFNDVLKSVESQTTVSQIIKGDDSKHISHMETQTDEDYKELLAVINS